MEDEGPDLRCALLNFIDTYIPETIGKPGD
jgi:hypothetical protein